MTGLPFPVDLDDLEYRSTPAVKFGEDLTDLIDDLRVRRDARADDARDAPEVRYDQGQGLAYLHLRGGQLISGVSGHLPARDRHPSARIDVHTNPAGTPGEVQIVRPGRPDRHPDRGVARLVLPPDMSVLLGRFLQDLNADLTGTGGRLSYLQAARTSPRPSWLAVEFTRLEHDELHLHDLSTGRDLTFTAPQAGLLRRACHAATRAYLHALNDPPSRERRDEPSV